MAVMVGYSKLIAKILIMIIQVNLLLKREEGNTNSPESLFLKFLLLTYHHSHFLATTLDFIFSWGSHNLQWAVFGLL